MRGSCPGLSVLAYDKLPPPPAKGSGKAAGGKRGRANEYHGLLPAWGGVGGVERGDAGIMARLHADRVLFLCYPPPALKSCMAYDSCAAFAAAGGQHLALVGLSCVLSVCVCVCVCFGRLLTHACTRVMHTHTHTHTHAHTHTFTGEFHGDTGSVRFERQLASKWTCTASITLPNWDNTTASLTLWTKNRKHKNVKNKTTESSVNLTEKGMTVGSEAGVTPSKGLGRWPVACVTCGRAPVSSGGGGGGGVGAGGAGGGGGGEGHCGEGRFLRDRMTRSVVVCSAACGQSAQARRALDAAFAAKHLPLAALGAGRGGGGDHSGDDAAGGAGFRWAESDLWRQVHLLS